MSLIKDERNRFHRKLLETDTLCLTKASKEHSSKHSVDYISCIADVGNKASVRIANLLIEKISHAQNLPAHKLGSKPKGQTLGDRFEIHCKNYLSETFTKLGHIRPGNWVITKDGNELGKFEQYSHLANLELLMSENQELRTFLGEGYTIKPDVVIARSPLNDEEINAPITIVDDGVSLETSIRASNYSSDFSADVEDGESVPQLILHASVSCKFTMRSDRAQNTRTEALNLIRSRKGRVPHIVAVTSEPMAGRIASLALGTGDMDCVYHFALHELRKTYIELELDDALDTLDAMINGKRLRDISDLPLDLSV